MTKEELLFEQAEKAMQEAADGVAEEARRTNGTVVVWENGAVRHIPADQLPPSTSPHPNPLPAGEGTEHIKSLPQGEGTESKTN